MRRLRVRDRHLGYFFVLPGVLMLVVILGFPAVMAVLNSFFPLWGRGEGFTIANYIRLFHDEVFWQVFNNTLIFVTATVSLHFVLGLAVALALNTQIRARRFFRVMMILPWTVPDVIAGLVWKFMYDPLSGIVNDVLLKTGLIGRPVEWLSNPLLALPSVIVADVWRGYPFVMLILLAGLQAISRDLYEAARIDGASTWQEFRHITIPGLKGVAVVALALDTIWQFRRFGLIYAMTQGGPGYRTAILPILVYKQYFRFFNFEYASAIATVAAIVMLIVSIPYIRAVVREA